MVQLMRSPSQLPPALMLVTLATRLWSTSSLSATFVAGVAPTLA